MIPKTYLHAMHITRALGIDYLWIDSLCIMQDCEEDWTAEAAAMADIYTNTYCTIAAAAAQDCHEGCYVDRNPLEFAPCHPIRKYDGLFVHLVGSPSASIEDLERASPLFKRAWMDTARKNALS